MSIQLDWIRNEDIQEVRMASIKEKISEHRLRWFVSIKCWHVDAPVTRNIV